MSTEEIMHPRVEDIKRLVAQVEQTIDLACRSCLSCGHFREKEEKCQLYGMRPPARIIAFGCPSYDYIPF